MAGNRFWMIRAGEGGYLIEDFEREGCVGIGWEGGDFTKIRTPDEMRKVIRDAHPDMKPGALAHSASMTFKFRHTVKPGDRVISYDPQKREYLYGTITGDYEYAPGTIPDYPHVRKVKWHGRVSRDDLSTSSKNSLGSTLTVFEPGSDVLEDLERALKQPDRPKVSVVEEEEEEEEFEAIRRDTLSKAHEFIKDRILELAPDEMESLVAALLRAMGYKARVTPKGADRGRDVIASPDGLGFQHPRIIAEVKHRPRESMGAEPIRGFLGGLHEGDRGLYVSTGGFTREARYEADRSRVPITLVDSDFLAHLVVEHYETFDSEGRSLVPLIRVYWPAG